MTNGFYYVKRKPTAKVEIYAYYKDGLFWAGHEPLYGVKIVEQ